MTTKIPLRWAKKLENTLNFDEFERALKGPENQLAAFVSQRNQLLKKALQNTSMNLGAINTNLKK
ncbi:MAG: hypothetical protein B7Y25_06640 [Alphaproteobacteria bacterium 16-39-46]|nr:MAG: hypothetical protein B7Y25_06640 [Alphaproteobacteria bacterium 16-39-46]OZA42235.1 MAG: hypothetical protein B7X84_06715 [Alphaproteobacteria bacterium 17-39-52]HQS84564.1 hypothetical protein [Alphaproteobacteria bacterium]HQS94350.1 hypothetical protein [Alphaproteobacteria bacterium]